MDAHEVAARVAITETIARYAHAADRGRFDDVAALFTHDGVLAVRDDEPRVGRDAILEFLRTVGADLAATSTTRLVRHHTSNLSIELAGPTEARARCYFFVLTEDGLDHWGRYRDRLVACDDGSWRFSRREVTTEGLVPGGFAASRRAT